MIAIVAAPIVEMPPDIRKIASTRPPIYAFVEMMLLRRAKCSHADAPY